MSADIHAPISCMSGSRSASEPRPAMPMSHFCTSGSRSASGPQPAMPTSHTCTSQHLGASRSRPAVEVRRPLVSLCEHLGASGSRPAIVICSDRSGPRPASGSRSAMISARAGSCDRSSAYTDCHSYQSGRPVAWQCSFDTCGSLSCLRSRQCGPS